MPTSSRKSASLLVHKIRSLLAARGLFLADVSRKSRLGPYQPHHHIPHNLYDAIRRRQFSPSIYQIAALSLLSGYQFVDWLELFGFSLDNVSCFQASFLAFRTVELDARIYHPRAKILWLRDVAPASFSAALVPLSQWLSPAEPRPADSLDSNRNTAFRFVKIGFQDAFAFPDLLPGSIVRVKPLGAAQLEIPAGNTPGKRLFLVEHDRGLVCSQIYRVAHNQIALCSRSLPYAPVVLDQGTQATVLGLADVEIRRTVKIKRPVVPARLAGYRLPDALPPRLPARDVGGFLQRARKRAGLSFREASARTKTVAQILRDSRYFCAPGSLSDHETRSTAPRHIHKLISICAVYFASVEGFLKAAGIELDGLGRLPMPVEFLERPASRTRSKTPSRSSETMNKLIERFQELPYFLHGAMPHFFSKPDLSVRDVFWAGGVECFTHPCLLNADFLVVDRRTKKARPSLACPKWAQPLYLFLRRDGTYLCGSYSKLNGILVIHPAIAGLPKLLRLRDRADVEVVGQIVGIVRWLK
jgi:hypothetical protein